MNAADLRRSISQGMGPELHWFPGDVAPARLAAVLVGMANTQGGIVLLGLAARSGQVLGIDSPAVAHDLVFQAALSADPPLVLPLPQVIRLDQRLVMAVQVPDGLSHVYSLEGRYLGRDGTQTNPLPARRLRQLFLERGLAQFESQPVPDASFADLDSQKVQDYLQALNLPGEEDPEEVLFRRGCIRRDLSPTYAGLLLFGRAAVRWLPNAGVLAARFSGTTLSDQYVKLDIRGTLPDQLRQAEAFVRQNIRSVVRLVGLTHQETPEFPLEAVRELLVNAVAHRDYNLQGDNIHLYIFSDRLEIHSPGGLPGPVTLQNLLEARFSRNAVIVQVLSDLGFVERLGYGLDRVVRVMRKSGLRSPRFEEVAGTFRVTLYGMQEPVQGGANLAAYRALELNSRQEDALDYLARHRRITNREYQELCPDVHPETLRRDLADLVAHGVLVKIGDKKATYYVLKK